MAAVLLMLISLACAGRVFASQGGGTAAPTVAVSILPQADFVRNIAGDKVKVLTLVGPGASPHSYEPTPRQMADLSSARILFTVGVDFEKALLPKLKTLYPRLRIVDTAKDIAKRRLEDHGDHEGHGESEESGPDPHVWLGQDEVRVQLAAIAEALCALAPESASFFRGNAAAYIRRIDEVFSELRKNLAPLRGKTVYVYHPSFGYFFDEFGIVQEAVETGGKEPTQKSLADLIRKAKRDGARIIIVQKQFSSRAAKTIADAIGGSVIEMDPLAPDWLANIREMGEALSRTIGAAGGTGTVGGTGAAAGTGAAGANGAQGAAKP